MKGRKPHPKADSKDLGTASRAPADLDAVAQREWRRVAPALKDRGVLTPIDNAALAAYCQAYSRWVKAEKALAKMAELDPVSGGLVIKTSNGNSIQNPLVGIANTAATAMVRFAAEFGMTPSARGRVTLPDGMASAQGKKEQANLASETAAKGTSWSELLH